MSAALAEAKRLLDQGSPEATARAGVWAAIAQAEATERIADALSGTRVSIGNAGAGALRVVKW